MARHRRSLAGSLGGYLSGSLGGAHLTGTSFSGVIDSIIAAGGTVRAAYSTSHRLYASYTGPLIRVRRASDNAQLDIGYSAATNRLDTAALAAHCGASDGFLVTTYDEAGSTRDVTQGTAANQPKIYDAATGVVLRGTLPTPTFTRASSQRLSRADGLGLSGAPALTYAYFGHAANTGTRSYMICAGGAGVNDFYCGFEAATGDPMNGRSGATRRNFTEATALTTSTFLLHRIAAGADMNTSTCRQDGADLVQSSVAAGGPLAITNTTFSLGSSGTPGNWWDGGGCAWLVLDGEATGAVLTALEAFGASLKLLSV